MKNRLLEQIRVQEALQRQNDDEEDDSEQASEARPLPSPAPEEVADKSQKSASRSSTLQNQSKDTFPQTNNFAFTLEEKKATNQSVLSENASTKISITDGSLSHASIKQRYLEEIQAFKANHSALLNQPKPKDEVKSNNIFFSSVTDKDKDDLADFDVDSIVSPKLEQKLFRLQYRKCF